MKRKLFIAFCMAISILKTFGQTVDPNEILMAAKNGCAAYLEKIPEGKEKLYGFNNRREFASVQFGMLYQMITLDKNFFEDSRIGTADYLIPTGEWRVPVMVNNESRILLTVARQNNKWEVVGLGGASLAKELETFQNTHPSKEKYGRMLRVYQMVSDFIISGTGAGSTTVYPLESAKMSLTEKGENVKPYSLLQLLQLIKNNVQKK